MLADRSDGTELPSTQAQNGAEEMVTSHRVDLPYIDTAAQHEARFARRIWLVWCVRQRLARRTFWHGMAARVYCGWWLPPVPPILARPRGRC